MAKLTSNTFIKAADVAAVAAEGLDYGASLAEYIWTNKKANQPVDVNDYVNIYVPSLMTAQKRELRANTEINVGHIHNNKIAVKLANHYYQAVPVSDAEMTLDINEFAGQIVAPIASGLSRSIEALIGTTISTASHKVSISSGAAPHVALAQANSKLTEFFVPQDGRVIVVGTGVQALMLSGTTSGFSHAGDNDAYRRGVIGYVYGAPVIVSPFVPADKAYMFHKSAFPLVSRVPRVTESTGSEWAYGTGSTVETKNVAISVVRDRDALRMRDIVVGSVFAGMGIVTDKGKMNKTGASATFTPWITDLDPASTADDCLIRSIEMVFTQVSS